MKRISFTFYSILIVSVAGILLSTKAVSQISFQAGGGIGYVIPSGDFGGTTMDFYAGSKYGISAGFNLHAKGRMNFQALGIVGKIGYTSMSNDGESEPGRGKVELSQKLFSIEVGPEYHVNLPGSPLAPYVGANLALNSFSGEVTFNGVANVPSGTFSVESATRLGLGFTGGAMFKISNVTSLDIGFSYQILNLIGRSWDDTDPSKDQRLDSYKSFNDEKDPIALDANEHFIGSSRSIHSFQITASILFNL